MLRPPDGCRAAFFTGERGSLFGVYHPAAPARDREDGVVIVPPLGHEYVRTHWLMREVAMRAAAAGLHVLRFDLSGAGDSAGQFEQTTVEGWCDDVRAAVQELKDQSGVSRVGVLGLRGGALLAFEAARQEAPQRLWLWDPVQRGADLVVQLRRMQSERRRDWPFAPAVTPGAPVEDLLGYPWPAALLAGVEALDLRRPPLPRTRHLHLLGPAALAPLAADLGATTRFHALTAVIAWDVVERFDEPLLLGPLANQVAAVLAEEAS